MGGDANVSGVLGTLRRPCFACSHNGNSVRLTTGTINSFVGGVTSGFVRGVNNTKIDSDLIGTTTSVVRARIDNNSMSRVLGIVGRRSNNETGTVGL